MDAVTIPAEIVAVGDALTTELAAWTRAQPNATLADHEQAVLGITRQVMAAGLWTACPTSTSFTASF